MLHISTKILGLPPKITKMLDNAHHTEAFSYLFQREKKHIEETPLKEIFDIAKDNESWVQEDYYSGRKISPKII